MTRRPTHIRAWRAHRGWTLRDLEARIATLRPEAPISYVSLGRIERGKQPYSQDTLEAIAEALDVEPAVLLAEPPEPGLSLLLVWRRLSPAQRRLAAAILQAIAAAG